MLTVKEALTKILDSCSALTETQNVSLYEAPGRVLANRNTAPINVPPEDNSAMDGYAIYCASVSKVPTTLAISQRIPAGSAPKKLTDGTAARIFTGGLIPDGADAVVIQENCQQSADGLQVKILKQVEPGENIRPCGQDVNKGALLFEPGHLLRPQDIGLLASVGISEIEVVKKPVVALFGTGDELIEPGQELQAGQIYNSNKYMLAAMIKQLGCDVMIPEETSVADNLQATKDALKSVAGKVDLILTTGGVSVGEEDYIKPAIEQLGEIQNWKINLKPGKPLVLGKISATPLVGLPGNPVSSFVTFLLFVAPLLRKLQGLDKLEVRPQTFPLGFAIERARQRPEFMRVRISNGNVVGFNNQSSGVLTSTVWADALALIPEEVTLEKGENVNVYFLNDLLNQEIK